MRNSNVITVENDTKWKEELGIDISVYDNILATDLSIIVKDNNNMYFTLPFFMIDNIIPVCKKKGFNKCIVTFTESKIPDKVFHYLNKLNPFHENAHFIVTLDYITHVNETKLLKNGFKYESTFLAYPSVSHTQLNSLYSNLGRSE